MCEMKSHLHKLYRFYMVSPEVFTLILFILLDQFAESDELLFPPRFVGLFFSRGVEGAAVVVCDGSGLEKGVT